MRNLANVLTMIVVAVTVVATPSLAAAPATQPRPATGEYDARFESRTLTIPSVGVVLLDERRATEKGAFLGVSVSTVSPELREQLKLRRGVGLVVNHVEAGSPAEAAGVKRFDVLERLDDQILVEPRQLSVLIRLRKAGDEVKLTLVREAKPQTVTATLAEKDLPALDDVLVPTPGWRTNPHLRGAIDAPSATLVPGGQFGIAWSDGELNIDLLQDHGRRLVARDKAGEVIFEGSIDTPEQLAKLPEVLKAKAMRIIKLSSTQPTTQATRTTTTQPTYYRNTLKPKYIPRFSSPAGEPVPSPAM